MSVDFQIICTFFRILEHAVYLARHMAVTSDHHGKKMPLAGACCIFETPSSEAKNPSIALQTRARHYVSFFCWGLYQTTWKLHLLSGSNFNTSHLSNKKNSKKLSIWVGCIAGQSNIGGKKYFNNECTFHSHMRALTF